MMNKRLRIGTRGSALALWQAHWVENELIRHGFLTEIVIISTGGDQNRQGPIANLGAQGVFTKEIQNALLRNEVDLAVHSLKDLPTEPVDGLEFVASPKRGDFRDAFVSAKAKTLAKLSDGAVIGTGSVRRKAQILNLYGERFKISDIRGNVETRLRKVDAGEFDAVVLAEAGLVRLGFERRIASFLEPPLFLPAVGQGAIGLEIRSNDTETRRKVLYLNDLATFAAVSAERALLATLCGGCLAPVAALGLCELIDGNAASRSLPHWSLTLTARVLSPDGTQKIETSQETTIEFWQEVKSLGEMSFDKMRQLTQNVHDRAAELGCKTANVLLVDGAERLLKK
ncbi:MAG: hydroxymethylbilane synthase [Planctomycetaceae bacterium]|nr:hydroxymethylbilane synthase [Planctomycetaceae bacterium]